MHLVLPSDATGLKESAAKLAGWPLPSTTKNSKDGGVNDFLCVATSEETVHRRSFVFQLQHLRGPSGVSSAPRFSLWWSLQASKLKVKSLLRHFRSIFR